MVVDGNVATTTSFASRTSSFSGDAIPFKLAVAVAELAVVATVADVRSSSAIVNGVSFGKISGCCYFSH
jgi:hypothetical protein